MIGGTAKVAALLTVNVLAMANPVVGIEPIHIMPIGDSITVGYTNLPGQPDVPFEYGYRGGLYTRLTAAGYSFEFVGSSPEHPSPGPSAVNLASLNQDYHNGYGGRGTSYIFDNITDWMAASNPDVILLMIGINNIAGGSSGNPIDLENQLNGVVGKVVAAKPTAHLIIAQTTPYSTYTDSLVQYNNYIKNNLVPFYAGQGKLVTTVDQYSNLLTGGAIDPSLFSNGINHPSLPAYDRLAQTWFQGIQALGTIAHTPFGSVIPSLHDENVLSGKPVVATSSYNASFTPAYITDGTSSSHVFKGTLV
jgi:hypothetical protein